jgi:hypothetical protein
MVSTKDRRHSGRKQIFADDPNYPTQYEFYDEWSSYKDGIHYDPDDTHIRPERMLHWWSKSKIRQMNDKLLKHLRIRKTRKLKQKMKSYYK